MYEQLFLLPVQNSGLSQASQRALQKMVSLFGLTQLVKDLGDLLEDDYASNQQASLIRHQQYAVSTTSGLAIAQLGCALRMLPDGLQAASCRQLPAGSRPALCASSSMQ